MKKRLSQEFSNGSVIEIIVDNNLRLSPSSLLRRVFSYSRGGSEEPIGCRPALQSRDLKRHSNGPIESFV